MTGVLRSSETPITGPLGVGVMANKDQKKRTAKTNKPKLSTKEKKAKKKKSADQPAGQKAT